MKNKDKNTRPKIDFNDSIIESRDEVINELKSSIYFKPADENAYNGKKLNFHMIDDIAHFATSTESLIKTSIEEAKLLIEKCNE
jgi:hypothetical protein